MPHDDGVDFTLVKEKAEKWLDMIETAIKTEYLDSGSAQKLSGMCAAFLQLLLSPVGACARQIELGNSEALSSPGQSHDQGYIRAESHH